MSVYTSLKTCQHVLGALESNNVNTCGGSIESAEVHRIMEEVYNELMAYGEWPHLNKITTLETFGQLAHPTYLRIPNNIATIKLFRYNQKELEYKTPEEFIDLTYKLDSKLDNVDELFSLESVKLNIINDQDPTYWTSFDEKYIVTDSYNKVEGSTLIAVNTVIYCKESVSWLADDDFIPNMPEEMFPTYLAKVKARAFLQLKREQSIPDERQASQGMSKIRRELSKLNDKTNRSRSSYGR
jgi:hypothetical protein